MEPAAARRCAHTGSDMCPQCSWSRPFEAVVLIARGRTVGRALPVALVVGTILSAVNQGTAIVAGAATTGVWIKVAVNYMVPFVVASVGYLSGRRRRPPRAPEATRWPRYLADFHDERPAITGRLLAHADSSPYAWLIEPLRSVDGPILDLACGSAPTRDHLRTARWIGLDSSPGELAAATTAGRGPLVRARADALPLADHSVAAVCAAMCLPVVTPLDQVLAELRRVMRPGATLVALVPSHLGMSPVGWVGWLRVMRALGLRDQPWPNPQARGSVGDLLREQGFTIDSDERRVFTLELSSPAAIELLVDSLYLPGVDPWRIARAKSALAERGRPGHQLRLPLRRVVGRATG